MADQVALLAAAKASLLVAGTTTAASVLNPGGTLTWAEIVDAYEDFISQIEGAQDVGFHKRLTTFYGELDALIVAG